MPALTHFRVVAAAALLAIFALATLLAGCDAQKVAELEEGVATEADVRARFGEPEKIWSAADMAMVPAPDAAKTPGARTYEYSRQPEGRTNYMITLGADGKMSALRQVLSSQNFAKVQPGMAMEQVRKMLGRPMKVTPYALKQQTEYDWAWLDGNTQPMVFTVVFDSDLKVVSTRSVDQESFKSSGGSR